LFVSMHKMDIFFFSALRPIEYSGRRRCPRLPRYLCCMQISQREWQEYPMDLAEPSTIAHTHATSASDPRRGCLTLRGWLAVVAVAGLSSDARWWGVQCCARPRASIRDRPQHSSSSSSTNRALRVFLY
jgi:hypothetical protein